MKALLVGIAIVLGTQVAAAQQDPYAPGPAQPQYDPSAQPPPQPAQPQYNPYAQPPPQPQYQQQPYAQQPYGDPSAYPVEQAAAPQYGFVGPHPEPYDYGSGICYIQGAHFHPYAPFDQYLFRQQGGYFYFIGDLGDFGYSGQLWGYAGNHPIPIEFGGGYCYIGWPHRHNYPAPASLQFSFVGGYYSYVGPWTPAYYTYRDRWAGYYTGYYRNSYYGGRYYTVRPPAIYRPAYRVGAPGVYRPGAAVITPGGSRVVVTAPQPAYGHPGYVGAPVAHPGYVNAPVAHPGYVVGAPAPVNRGYVGAPAEREVRAPAPAPMAHPMSSPPPAAPQRRRR